jgi:hypothetical protein
MSRRRRTLRGTMGEAHAGAPFPVLSNECRPGGSGGLPRPLASSSRAGESATGSRRFPASPGAARAAPGRRTRARAARAGAVREPEVRIRGRRAGSAARRRATGAPGPPMAPSPLLVARGVRVASTRRCPTHRPAAARELGEAGRAARPSTRPLRTRRRPRVSPRAPWAPAGPTCASSIAHRRTGADRRVARRHPRTSRYGRTAWYARVSPYAFAGWAQVFERRILSPPEC